MDLHQEIDNIDDFALMTVDQADDNVVLPIELTNTTGTCLQQLNTDCLMEIFSSNSLTLMDLCSIAETCTRFKEIAENIFPKDLSVESFEKNIYRLDSKKFGEIDCCMQLVERTLKNFGQYISRVSMKEGDALVNLVAEYCGTVTLERLDIRQLRIGGQGEGLNRKLKTVFQRMLALSFYSCDLMTLATYPYIIRCDSLIELKIAFSGNCVTMLRNTFPKLERFTFYGNFIFSERYCNKSFSEILPNFLRRHKRLRILHLSSKSVCCSSQLMETIANNCTELTNLTLERWRSPKTSFNFSHLKTLRKLSMLAVDLEQIDHRQLIALLEEVKSLTTLKLGFVYEDVPEIFSAVSQLQNLRELHLEPIDIHRIPWSRLTQLKTLHIHELSMTYIGHQLPYIIRELTNLEELVYTDMEPIEDDQFKLSRKAFSEIVKIVERRPNKLTLTCHLSRKLAKNYDRKANVNLIEYKDYD